MCVWVNLFYKLILIVGITEILLINDRTQMQILAHSINVNKYILMLFDIQWHTYDMTSQLYRV